MSCLFGNSSCCCIVNVEFPLYLILPFMMDVPDLSFGVCYGDHTQYRNILIWIVDAFKDTCRADSWGEIRYVLYGDAMATYIFNTCRSVAAMQKSFPLICVFVLFSSKYIRNIFKLLEKVWELKTIIIKKTLRIFASDILLPIWTEYHNKILWQRLNSEKHSILLLFLTNKDVSKFRNSFL